MIIRPNLRRLSVYSIDTTVMAVASHGFVGEGSPRAFAMMFLQNCRIQDYWQSILEGPIPNAWLYETKKIQYCFNHRTVILN